MIQPDLLREDSDFPVQFGRYTLQGILGEGGMARVFRAELQGAEGFRKPAAVKIVRSAVAAGNDNLRKALINEARVGGLLHHPNVVETYDYGEVDGHPYIAMEFVRGVVLDEVIERVPRLEPGRALEIAIQISAGLDHAHNLSATGQNTNLVHRDLKPSNIIISQDGLVKVMDFGIAKASALSSTLTQTGTTKGTPAYMSPEQVGGQKLDRRSDLFSLGAIIGELALGKRMFGGDSLISVLSAVIQVEERLANSGVLDELEAYLPGLGTIVHRCLRMNPDLRYSDAARVEAALEELASGLAPTVPIMKLWVRDLMSQAKPAAKATPTRSSWSSLDKEYLHEPTLQTDAPPSRPLAAAPATEDSVGVTRAQVARSAGDPQLPAEVEVPTTRAQTGYPLAPNTEPMLNSRDEVPSTTVKPAGTLWTQGDSKRGLPIGLLVGAVGGLLIALAVVGAMVLANRIGPTEDRGAGELAADTADPVDGDQEELTLETTAAPIPTTAPRASAKKPKRSSSRSRAAVPTPNATPAPQATTATGGSPTEVQPTARPNRFNLGIKPSLLSSPTDSKLPPTMSAAKGQERRGTTDDTKAVPTWTTASSRQILESTREVQKPTDEQQALKTTQKAQQGQSSEVLKQRDLTYLRRPKWSWIADSEDGRRRGQFSMKTRGVDWLDATVHVSFPNGVARQLKLKRSGKQGDVEVWHSRVTFPNSASGKIEWRIEVHGKHTDETLIDRKYDGKAFRL